MSEKTQKEDRRTRYTRQVIKEAFLKLLEEISQNYGHRDLQACGNQPGNLLSALLRYC